MKKKISGVRLLLDAEGSISKEPRGAKNRVQKIYVQASLRNNEFYSEGNRFGEDGVIGGSVSAGGGIADFSRWEFNFNRAFIQGKFYAPRFHLIVVVRPLLSNRLVDWVD